MKENGSRLQSEVNGSSEQANAPAVSQDSSTLTGTNETSVSDKTPPDKRGKCKYCASYLLPEAKVCTVCNRHKNRVFNHLRVDHIGIVATLIMVLFAASNLQLTSKNLELASENLTETKQKHVEATAALEKVVLAEGKISSLENEAKAVLERIRQGEATVTNLQNVLREAQVAVSDLEENINFNMLLIKANNDDRPAFNSLVEISKKSGPFRDIANISILQIVSNITSMLQIQNNYPWHTLNADPKKISLQEFRNLYKSFHHIHKVAYMDTLMAQQRFSKFEKFQILAEIIKDTISLKELERACQYMNQEAKIDWNILSADKYVQWWEQNKSKYESSPPAVKPGE